MRATRAALARQVVDLLGEDFVLDGAIDGWPLLGRLSPISTFLWRYAWAPSDHRDAGVTTSVGCKALKKTLAFPRLRAVPFLGGGGCARPGKEAVLVLWEAGTTDWTGVPVGRHF